MAYLQTSNVRIVGISAAVPKEIKRVVDEPCFDQGVSEAEKVSSLTGVKERRIAPEGMICSDYCQKAAENLLAELNWDKSSIDALIYVSVCRDYIEPNTATVLQGKLGLPKECYSIDLPNACSGYCYGLSVVSSLMMNGFIKRALFLVGDTQSKMVSQMDKTLWPLTGDAGTATALEYDVTAPQMLFNLYSDGSRYEAIIAPSNGTREPFDEKAFKMEELAPGVIRNRTHIGMDGMSVFSFVISDAPKCILSTCEHYGFDIQDIDFLLLHQANMYIDEKIRKKLKLPSEKVPYSIDYFGNCSSGTIPMTMCTRIAKDLSTRHCLLLLCGFGAGLSWGSVVLETDCIKVLPLIEI